MRIAILTVDQDVSQIQNARKLAWFSAFALPVMLAPVWLMVTPSWATPTQVGTVFGLLLMLLVAVVTYTDVRWRKIPNWGTYTAFARRRRGMWTLEVLLTTGVLFKR